MWIIGTKQHWLVISIFRHKAKTRLRLSDPIISFVSSLIIRCFCTANTRTWSNLRWVRWADVTSVFHNNKQQQWHDGNIITTTIIKATRDNALMTGNRSYMCWMESFESLSQPARCMYIHVCTRKLRPLPICQFRSFVFELSLIVSRPSESWNLELLFCYGPNGGHNFNIFIW